MLTVIVILVLVLAGGYVVYKRRNSFKSEEDLVKEVLSSIKLTQDDLPPFVREEPKPAEEKPQPVEEPVVTQPVAEPTKPARKYYRRKNKPKK